MRNKLCKWRLFGGFVAVVMLVAGFLAIGAPARAQMGPAGQGLTITPFLLERQMQKGDTSNEIIDIINTSDQPMPVDITINDFVPVGDNGQQLFMDGGKGDPRYSLSSWITIESNPKQNLAPHERTSLEFSIHPPMNAEDGGHYGAILFSFMPPQPEGSAVAVAQKLGAIILVKLGKVSESGQIVKFGAIKFFHEYPPVEFTTVFKNTGNVHVKPRGSIVVTNMFGRKIASVLVNENANNVLADTERAFTSTWKDRFGFGPYRAEVRLVYGDSGQIETARTTFWIIPWKITLAVAAGLFILLVLLIGGVRRYNRWLLKRAYAVQPVKKDK